MRLVWVVGLVGISLGVAIGRPAAVSAIHQQIYPSNPAQQRALDECFLEDNRFDRLYPIAREECYRHNSPDLAQGRPPATENFVDRWREAGEGHMSQNDIRAEQHNAR